MAHNDQSAIWIRTGKKLAAQVKADRRTLRKAYQTVVEGERRGAEEWLRDNYYLLERAAASAERDLKKAPALPSLGGKPVVYALCEQAVESASSGAELERRLWDTLESAGGAFSSRELTLCGLFLQTALVHSAARSLKREDDAFGRAVEGVRAVSSLDAEELIARFCPMEQILFTDPAGIYREMEERTRALYRKVCARRAQREGMDEQDFARRAVEMASKESDPRRRHVGYFILETDPKRARLRRRGRAVLWLRGLLPLALSIALSALLGIWWLFPLLYLPFFQLLRPLVEWLAV